ncbi:MAG: sporulation protein YabP [Ruminococcaceae bacterium]|nr:sporulation protein YabP [Oscillospiraceae bacterium]
MQESITVPHSINLDNRSVLILTGIKDVSGFDEQTVNLLTPMGTLIVKGEQLHINKLSLDTGEVTIDGKINSLQYLGDMKQKGFMSKIFR